MNKQVLVSVVMLTYGHEKYIREAIEGVLMQEVDFPVRLIVVDDCSPDGTEVIVRNIIATHPKGHWIDYIKHDQNKGMMPNFISALQVASGKYIALCEGDDYWTDSNKLQKQVEFLESNPDYVLSFHKIKVLKTNGDLVDDFITVVPENYETRETLARLGNYIHTPSVVFKNVIKTFPPEFLMTPIGDYFLYLLLSEQGKLKYIDEEMAVYRFGVGVHSALTRIKMAKANFKLFTLLLSYSKNTGINQILLDRQLKAFDNFEYLIRSEYREAFVSHHVFFKALQSLKHPDKFWRKFKNKFN